MEKKFQYILYGAILTLLVIAGVFTFVISDTQADETTNYTENKQIEVSNPSEIVNTAETEMEDDPLPNTLFNQGEQELSEEENKQPLIDSNNTEVEKDTGEAVLAKVDAFNMQKIKALLSEGGGWIFVEAQRYAPNSGNASLPNGLNLPVSQRIENWYYVEANGYAYQSYDRMLDENGNPIQEGYFREGIFYNEKQEFSHQLETNAFLLLPDQDAYGFLRRDFESGGELAGWVDKQDDRMVYIATSTSYFEKPVEFGVSTYKVVSTQYQFIYDVSDGSFLYGETVFVLENGEKIVWESITQTAFDMVVADELPEQLTQFLADNK